MSKAIRHARMASDLIGLGRGQTSLKKELLFGSKIIYIIFEKQL